MQEAIASTKRVVLSKLAFAALVLDGNAGKEVNSMADLAGESIRLSRWRHRIKPGWDANKIVSLAVVIKNLGTKFRRGLIAFIPPPQKMGYGILEIRNPKELIEYGND